MAKQRKTEDANEQRIKEYLSYRAILNEIAHDPDEPATTRMSAIKQIFEFDDMEREKGGVYF